MRPALQIAMSVGPMHILVAGTAVCGTTIHAADVFPDNAGLRQWNDGIYDRCQQCEHVLGSRIGHATRTRAAA